jgi:taurine dioxygenase
MPSIMSFINKHTLTGSGFGVEITGLDLTALNGQTRALLIDAFHASGGLLMIRDQGHIDPRHLRDFAALFGTLEYNEKYNPAFLLPDYPEILRIGNTKENGAYTALFIKADPLPLLWHTDDSFRHPQPIGSCLFCIHTPPEGGETGFAGMTAAYDALDDQVKTRIDDLETVHSYNHLNEMLRQKNPHRPPLSEEMKKQHPPIIRPLVAQHPVTGRKALYLPLCHIESVQGLPEDEGRRLLTDLLTHATQPAFTYMHVWRPGDLILWDNRCALHAPTPFDESQHLRLMYRLTVNGSQIVGF